MKSELCKSCVHTNVCGKDKNLVGDAFVLGDPMFFDNSELYRKYKEREEAGFPCDDYLMECKPEKMTRADRIRSMTDEELAEFVSSGYYVPHCPTDTGCPGDLGDHDGCDVCWLKWMKQEVQ